MKLKEPKRLISIFILVYIVYVSLLLADHFSDRQNSKIGAVTGMSSTGTVRINLGGAVPAPGIDEDHKKQAEEPSVAEAPAQPSIIPAVLLEQPLAPALFGDIGMDGVLQIELGLGETAKFTYNGQPHSITLTGANSDGIMLEIESKKILYFIPFAGSITIDIDLDGVDDTRLTAIRKNEDRFIITVAMTRQPETRLPIGLELLKKEFQKTKNTVLALAGMITVLLFAAYYSYKNYVARELKIDKTLTAYVQSALEKGFIEPQIGARLLEHGFDKEEVDYIFKHLKNSIPNKK